MRNTFLPLSVFACIFMVSCNKSKPVESTTQANSNTTVLASLKKDARKIGPEKSKEQSSIENARDLISKSENKLIGYWVGPFGKTQINIALSEVKDGKVSGHSVCAGNYRAISGTVIEKPDSIFDFVMEEPGSDQYDGKFQFSINMKQRELAGSWAPFKANSTSAKKYSLKKTDYIFNPEAGVYPKTSTTLLTKTDVENMDGQDLRIMRNEIYARHGYSFKDKDLRAYFDQQDWYMPMAIDVRDELTETEAKNIDLIYQYEEYYKQQYDNYGR
jgi:hypothetical protein